MLRFDWRSAIRSIRADRDDSDDTRQEEKGDEDNYVSPTLELVRVIDRTIHVSPIDRQKEVDFTVRNPSNQEFNFLFLPLRQFERNLQVYDENGVQLAVYPNSEVKQILAQARDHNEERVQEIEERFEYAEYTIFLQLPPERPLGAGELRTIRLTFEQSDPVKFANIWDPSLLSGWKNQWEKKFFNVPSFFADVERFPTDFHDVFVVVVGSPGYAAKGTSELEGKKPGEEIYENGLDDSTRVLSTRLPAAEKCGYCWNLHYDLVPSNRNLMILLAGYWLAAVVLGLISFVLPGLGLADGITGFGLLELLNSVTEIDRTLSTGFLTATIGLIFALRADWTDRYKILSVIPLVLHGMAWVLWTFAESSI